MNTLNNMFTITMPAKMYIAGKDIIVTDPCYFLGRKIWDLLMDEWFHGNEETETSEKGVIEFNNGAKVLYSSTAHGDGSYPVFVDKSSGKSVHANETGVDAGLIAVVTIEDLRKIEKDYDMKDKKPFDVDNKWFPRINDFNGEVEADDKGNFIGDLEVNTQGEIESEEYIPGEDIDDEEEPF